MRKIALVVPLLSFAFLGTLPCKEQSFASFKKDKFGNTPIHQYARDGKLEELTDIINKHGKENILINIENKTNSTPLHLAAREGNIKVMQYLLETFEDTIFPDLQNKNGETPLHLAVKNNRVQAVKLLLEQGANPNLKNKAGKDALQLAQESRKKKYPKKRVLSIISALENPPAYEAIEDEIPEREESTVIKPKDKLDEKEEKHLNLLIFLDKGGEEEEGVEKRFIKPVTTKLMRSIKNHLPTIASRNLLSNIIRNEGKKTNRKAMINQVLSSLRNKNEWLIYVTGKNLDESELSTSEFVILIPKKLHPIRSLSDISLGGSNAIQISNDNLKQLVTPRKKMEIKFSDVDQLISIFEKNPTIRKRVYINGHGGYDKTIANMYFDDYQKFITRLAESGSDFLFVATCFGAGTSLLKAHQALREDYDNQVEPQVEVTFPIVLGALTDTPTQGLKGSNYGAFFKELDAYFATRGKNIPTTTHPFQDMLRHLTGPILNHTPSIRLPGLRGYFRPVDVDDKVELITYPLLLKHELSHVKKGLSAILLPSTKKKEEHPFQINKEAVLLYPSIVDLPLESQNNQPPKIISMMAGDARHYLKKLILNTSLKLDDDRPNKDSLFTIMKKMFLSGFQYKRASKKVIFIQELECNNVTLSNLLIVSHGFKKNLSEGEDSSAIKLDIIGSLNDEYFNLQLRYTSSGKKVTKENISLEDIGKKEAIEKINDEIMASKPEKGALFEASGGIDSDQRLERLVKRALGLVKESFMEEQIRRAKLRKAQKEKEQLDQEQETESIEEIDELESLDY